MNNNVCIIVLIVLSFFSFYELNSLFRRRHGFVGSSDDGRSWLLHPRNGQPPVNRKIDLQYLWRPEELRHPRPEGNHGEARHRTFVAFRTLWIVRGRWFLENTEFPDLGRLFRITFHSDIWSSEGRRNNFDSWSKNCRAYLLRRARTTRWTCLHQHRELGGRTFFREKRFRRWNRFTNRALP